jgi:3-dehydroquinate dehydratase-2
VTRILILQGPNLNRLGTREPSHYGRKTLDEIHGDIALMGTKEGFEPLFFQSSHEGALIDRIHQAADEHVDGIVANLGAYTHTSIAIRDAFLSVGIPVVEVHLSNVYRRESFRTKSLISDIAEGVISGMGPVVYRLGIIGLLDTITRKKPGS